MGLLATTTVASLALVLADRAQASGCEGLPAALCKTPVNPTFPPLPGGTGGGTLPLNPLPSLLPPCDECTIEKTVIGIGATGETAYLTDLSQTANVVIPLDFIESLESLEPEPVSIWLRSEDGDSQLLWPLERNRGKVLFAERFTPTNAAEAPIEAGPPGLLIIADAMRFRPAAELRLEVQLSGGAAPLRVPDTTIIWDGLQTGSPASGGCSACSLQINDSSMTLQVNYRELVRLWQISLKAGNTQLQAWPPSAQLRSVRSENGAVLLELPLAPSPYYLQSAGRSEAIAP